ncbi:MAG: pimeloyl-ACP methyl ester esterase BioH [Mariprofundaceae bacterium]|nr:pimeloyl-ACP methyl ester esterase BioH [Mariprofundaceae bacterium]
MNIHQQGHGPALTLIHGWGMNSAVFAPLAARLAQDFCVILVDLPGYGRSSWAGEDLAAQLQLLAQTLPPSMLIGHSLGGVYAQALASRYPERFSRLLLLNYNPCFVQRDDWSCAVSADVFGQFAASLESGWQGTIRRFLGLQMHGVAQSRERVRTMTRLLIDGGAPQPQVLQFGLELLLQSDTRAELATLPVPAKMLFGERDTLVPQSVAAQIHRLNAAIGVECVARCAHAPFLSHADNTIELICEFAQSSTPRQDGG